MSTLNLGIVAHVDAGKTSLTERLLFAAGVIDDFDRVDDGNTQTDTMALERQRGITIKSAVVSFAVGGLIVNLIDTPGHPDFIAEVERTLAVLDGAVLVISAVEGVQAQTRVLMRALRRLALPTLIFVNKIDRAGARDERVLAEIREKLTPEIVSMGSVQGLGTRRAVFSSYGADNAAFTARLTDVLADHDDRFLASSGWSKWSSSAGDFRNLTPLVLMSALRRAGTRVYEPVHRFHLEAPADTAWSVLPALARLGAIPDPPVTQGSLLTMTGDIPAARVHELDQQLPALTHGAGVLDATFGYYCLARTPAQSKRRALG